VGIWEGAVHLAQLRAGDQHLRELAPRDGAGRQEDHRRQPGAGRV